MKRTAIIIAIVCLSVLFMFSLFGCQRKESSGKEEKGGNTADNSSVTAGTQTYRGFSVDNVYHSENNGDIHFNLYLPESYDGSKPYALYIYICAVTADIIFKASESIFGRKILYTRRRNIIPK